MIEGQCVEEQSGPLLAPVEGGSSSYGDLAARAACIQGWMGAEGGEEVIVARFALASCAPANA